MLGPGHFPAAPVARCVRDFIHFKPVREFTIIFFHLDVTELIINEKRIILTGGNPKINDHNARIAINHQVTGIVPMKETYPVESAFIANIGPGKLAHCIAWDRKMK